MPFCFSSIFLCSTVTGSSLPPPPQPLDPLSLLLAHIHSIPVWRPLHWCVSPKNYILFSWSLLTAVLLSVIQPLHLCIQRQQQDSAHFKKAFIYKHQRPIYKDMGTYTFHIRACLCAQEVKYLWHNPHVGLKRNAVYRFCLDNAIFLILGLGSPQF